MTRQKKIPEAELEFTWVYNEWTVEYCNVDFRGRRRHFIDLHFPACFPLFLNCYCCAGTTKIYLLNIPWKYRKYRKFFRLLYNYVFIFVYMYLSIFSSNKNSFWSSFKLYNMHFQHKIVESGDLQSWQGGKSIVKVSIYPSYKMLDVVQMCLWWRRRVMKINKNAFLKIYSWKSDELFGNDWTFFMYELKLN